MVKVPYCTIGAIALQAALPSLPENKKVNSNYRNWRSPIPVKNYFQQLSNEFKKISLKKQIIRFSQQTVFRHCSQIYWCFEKVKKHKSQLLLFIGRRNIQRLLWNFAFMVFGGIIIFFLR